MGEPPPDLYRHDKPESRKADCRLGSKTRFSAEVLRPLQLKVIDNETCYGSEKVHPCRRFSGLIGEDIETVGCDGNSCR